MIATHIFFLWHVRAQISRGDPDFTVFYTAARMLREGRGAELYHSQAQLAVQAEFTRNSDLRRGPLPYIHPPFEALFFLPLTFLSYAHAFAVWNLVNLGILFAFAILIRNSLPSLQTASVWQIVLLCLAFFPIFANFHQGQDAILLLLLVTLSFRALDHDAQLVAGCWLGLGLFKYHLILPVAALLAFWRGSRFVAGFAGAGSILALISLRLVGWKEAVQYPAYAWRVVSHPWFGGVPPRQLPSLFGLLAGWPFSHEIGAAMQVVVAAVSVAILMILVALRKRASDRDLFQLCFASAVITALLVGYSVNSYDLSLLVLPIAVSADVLLRGHMEGPSAWSKLLMPAIPLLISPLWFFLWLRWQRTNLMALSLLWWLFAIVAEVRRGKRHTHETLSESSLIANV